MSFLDFEISVYNGVTDHTGIVTTLGKFLQSRRHVARILELRRENDLARKKAIKLSLPMATVSGVFFPQRKIECMKHHNGLICLDFDAKDNEGISMEDMLYTLCGLDYVAYVAMSVSGTGLFAICPLAHPEQHELQFLSLKREMKEHHGLTVDAACRDVTRLRALSYDPTPYINEYASRYEGVENFRNAIAAPSLTGADGDMRKVARCVSIIEDNNIDITGTYSEWYHIGAALSSLGEAGRYYFHVVSRQYPKYSYAETDRKFTELLRTIRNIGLGSFFYWCSQYGINYKSV
jgi:hypothetical protein